MNQAVKRNPDRFPDDFMFQLTSQEWKQVENKGHLRSQFVTSKQMGGLRYQPFAITEQGVAMLSSVLRSERAVKMNIAFDLPGTNRDFTNNVEKNAKIVELLLPENKYTLAELLKG